MTTANNNSTLTTTTAKTFTSFLLSFTYTWMIRFTSISIGFVVIVGSILYTYQDNLLYFPEINGIPRKPQDNPRGYRSPEERNLPYESHMITCSDNVQIHAWLLHAPIHDWTTAPTFIFFHGNAGNIGLRIPNAIQMLQQLQVNVLMVEYRGYGNSDATVKPNEHGLQLDAQAALLFVHEHTGLDSTKVFLFGRSLGGSVAIYLAKVAHEHHIPLAGIIVENTFTSISDMVDIVLPFLSPIKRYVLRIGWNSISQMHYIGTHHIPILFLAGAKDELVPHRQMIQLYETTKRAATTTTTTTTTTTDLVRIHVIPNGTHNESWLQGGMEYWDVIRNFISTTTTTVQAQAQNSKTTASDETNSKKYSFHTTSNTTSTEVTTTQDVSTSAATSNIKKEL